ARRTAARLCPTIRCGDVAANDQPSLFRTSFHPQFHPPRVPIPREGLFDQPKQYTSAGTAAYSRRFAASLTGISTLVGVWRSDSTKALSKPHQSIGRFQLFTTIGCRKWLRFP